MSNDAPSESAPAAASRQSDVRLARAQIDAARSRHQHLVASGQLAAHRPNETGPPKALPGYTLLRELHRGGQGVVYLAVQKSTERQVAIKLLNRELPHRSGGAALARFEREIDILSRLKHPNIVTIHDCGRDHGRVYLVMDYIDGQPVDLWVRRDGASLSDTLEVFAKICDGVNAAHLRGVIHRDLKPGNILVDHRGQPHVLDFGLAKLAEDSQDVLAAFAHPMTVTGQFVGSLPWASPEQAEGRSDAMDIRSDVYSLGVILYQLLTGQFPYPVTGRLSDVVRHIVQSDPVRPSAIDRTIDRELETILLKCLSKEVDRRYQSAGELARDVRRYVAGEAIEARRDSLVYIMSKRLERYRTAALVAAAMLLVVVVALVVSLAFWRHAARQHTLAQRNATSAQLAADRADREASQARAVNDFMRDVLASADPENQGADVRLVAVLSNASGMVSQRFAGHPQQEAQVRDLLGHIYDKLSFWTESVEEFRRAHQLWIESAGPDDQRTLATQYRLALGLVNSEQTTAAETVLTDLIPRLEQKYGEDDPRTLAAYRDVALTQVFRGRVDEAEHLLLRLRTHPMLVNDDATQVRILAALIQVHMSRVEPDGSPGARAAYRGVEPLALEWIERATRLLGPNAVQTLHARGKWASVAVGMGRYRDAAQVCREILDHPIERLGACHSIRTSAMYILAEALHVLGDDVEPGYLHLERLRCVRQQLADIESPLYLASIGDALRYVERAGLAVEGEAMTRELCAALSRLGGGHGYMMFISEMYLPHFLSIQRRFDEAEPLFTALFEQARHIHDSPRMIARLHLYYGQHLTRRGQFQQAEAELNVAANLAGSIRYGTWDTHPDDIALAFAQLYDARGMTERAEEYQRLRAEIRHALANEVDNAN